jgi:hypothetical protein
MLPELHTTNVTEGWVQKGTLTHNSMLPHIAFSRGDTYESTIQTQVSGNVLSNSTIGLKISINSS